MIRLEVKTARWGLDFMNVVFLLEADKATKSVHFLSKVVVTKESRAHYEYVGTLTVFKSDLLRMVKLNWQWLTRELGFLCCLCLSVTRILISLPEG